MDHTIRETLEFHEAFGIPTGERPSFPPMTESDKNALNGAAATLENVATMLHAYAKEMPGEHTLPLRGQLMVEEVAEVLRALAEGDVAAALHELCDLRYVADGTVAAIGCQHAFLEAFAEVHEANMAKLHDGKPVRDAAGRVQKPEGWQPANVRGVVDRYVRDG